jgi:hypothetical protein
MMGMRGPGARHRSRHHAKDKQRFVVSVVAYDSLPGHQRYDLTRFSTTLYDAAPVRERNAVRQLIDYSTLHWRSLVTWRGLIRKMGVYGTTAPEYTCVSLRERTSAHFVRLRTPDLGLTFVLD